MFCRNKEHSGEGFTLIELLVGIAIIGLLSGIIAAGVSSARSSAEKVEVKAGARSLIQAYLLTPLENNGQFLPGYANVGEILIVPGGRRLHPASEEAKRYPWRLAEYMDGGVRGLFVSDHLRFYDEFAKESPYAVSLNPSFGINSTFVGGHQDGRRSDPGYSPSGRFVRDPALPRNFWVLRPEDAHNPSNLIVFAASIGGSTPFFDEPVGFFRVTPPQSPGTVAWGSYDPEIPASMGHLSLEFGGEAVVSHLDGSTAFLSEEEIRDMRRWSNQASIYDDPNFSSWNRDD
ncbi:MAG: type II secretion system protein [Verrucomicrobiota bacterium]